MKTLFQILLIIPLILACSENEPIATVFPIAGENSVDLSHPIPGQKSVYVRYTTSCTNGDEKVTFTGDTIQLSVENDHSKLIFKETLSMHSPLLISSQIPQNIFYEYELHNGYSLIKERINSQLFFFYGNDTLFLNNKSKVQLLQTACQLTFGRGEAFVGEEIGHFDEFEVGQIFVSDKDAVSCIPSFFNMEAYLIYDRNHLSMSHTIQQGEIFGWLQIQ